MKNRKLSIILLLIIIVFIVSVIMFFALTYKEKDKTIEEEEKTEFQILKDDETYYQIIDIVSDYAFSIENNDVAKIKSLLDTSYLKKYEVNSLQSSNSEEFYNYSSYNPSMIYEKTKKSVTVFLVYGSKVIGDGEGKGEKFNAVVKIDKGNNSYSIIPEISDNIKNDDSLFCNIEKNEYNELKKVNVDSSKIANRFFSDYIYMTLTDIEKSYNYINNEYKEKKFSNDIKKYIQYANKKFLNYKNGILPIEKCKTYKKDGENFYYIEDSQKNYFIIKQKDVFNFEIYLDCYTIETEAENYIYNQLKQANKVLYNARNIIDSINTEDYDYLYSHVDNIENEKEQYVKYLRNYISDSALKVQKEELSVNSKKYEYIATLQDEKDSIKNIKINIELQQNIRFLIKIVMD